MSICYRNERDRDTRFTISTNETVLVDNNKLQVRNQSGGLHDSSTLVFTVYGFPMGCFDDEEYQFISTDLYDDPVFPAYTEYNPFDFPFKGTSFSREMSQKQVS